MPPSFQSNVTSTTTSKRKAAPPKTTASGSDRRVKRIKANRSVATPTATNSSSASENSRTAESPHGQKLQHQRELRRKWAQRRREKERNDMDHLHDRYAHLHYRIVSLKEDNARLAQIKEKLKDALLSTTEDNTGWQQPAQGQQDKLSLLNQINKIEKVVTVLSQDLQDNPITTTVQDAEGASCRSRTSQTWVQVQQALQWQKQAIMQTLFQGAHQKQNQFY